MTTIGLPITSNASLWDSPEIVRLLDVILSEAHWHGVQRITVYQQGDEAFVDLHNAGARIRHDSIPLRAFKALRKRVEALSGSATQGQFEASLTRQHLRLTVSAGLSADSLRLSIDSIEKLD